MDLGWLEERYKAYENVYNEIGVIDCDRKTGVITNSDLDVIIGWELGGANSGFKTAQEISDTNYQLLQILNSLRVGTVIEVSYRLEYDKTHSRYEAYKKQLHPDSELAESLVAAKDKFYGSTQTKKISIHLFAIVPWNQENTRLRYGTPKRQKHHSYSEAVYSAQQEQLKEFECIGEQLMQAGISAKRMGYQEVVKYCSRLLNPRSTWLLKDTEMSPPGSAEDDEFLASIAQSKYWEYPEGLRIDGVHVTTGTCLKLGDSIAPLSITKILEGIQENSIFKVTLRKLDETKAASALKQKRRFSIFFMREDEKKDYVRFNEIDALEAEKAEQPDLIKPLEMSMSVACEGETPEAAEQALGGVIRRFSRENGLRFHREDYGHLWSYLAFLPGNFRYETRVNPIESPRAVYFLPVHKRYSGTPKVNLYFRNENEEEVGIHLAENKLRQTNGLIMGPTGAGKSFFVSYLIESLLLANSKQKKVSENNLVIVIDVEGHYSRLAEVLGGEYVEITPGGKFSLNPFTRKKELQTETEQYDTETISFLVNLLEKMNVNPGSAGFDGYMKHAISESIRKAYDQVEEDQAPALSAVCQAILEVQVEDEKVNTKLKQLVNNLKMFTATSGVYTSLFNIPNTQALDKNFLVFDLGKLEKDILPVSIFILGHIITSKLNQRMESKYLFFDECAQHMKDEISAALIAGLYQRVRKKGGRVYSIVQEASKLYAEVNDAVVKAMVGNSDIRVIFKQNSGQDYETLKNAMLNEQEIERIKEMVYARGEYADVFLKFGEEAMIMRLSVSPLEYWLFTTDKADVQKLEEVQSTETGLLQILLDLAARYPKGVRYEK